MWSPEFFFIVFPPSASGAIIEVYVHVVARRLLHSVRHRVSKHPSYVLHYSSLRLAFLFGAGARPSLEDSNHSGLDLISAWNGKPELGIGEVSFSV